RHGKAVAPEQGQEPGDTGRWHELQMVCALDGKPQGGHILERLVVEAVELLIARLDLKRCVLPLTEVATCAGAARLSDAMIRRVIEGLPIADRIEQTRVPCLARLELEFETDSAIGVDRF